MSIMAVEQVLCAQYIGSKVMMTHDFLYVKCNLFSIIQEILHKQHLSQCLAQQLKGWRNDLFKKVHYKISVSLASSCKLVQIIIHLLWPPNMMNSHLTRVIFILMLITNFQHESCSTTCDIQLTNSDFISQPCVMSLTGRVFSQSIAHFLFVVVQPKIWSRWHAGFLYISRQTFDGQQEGKQTFFNY